MAQTYTVTDACPICGDTMTIARLECGNCGSALEGAFRLGTSTRGAATAGQRGDETRFGRLARLDQTQLEFVEAFLSCRGVIKNMEDMLGISYPTVKARLAAVLEAMGVAGDDEPPAADQRRARREILAELAAGRITTEAAHALLLQAPTASGDDEQDDD